MFDPEFDPYALLQVHQDELSRQHHLITQLIQANNNLQTTMVELTQQHQRLVQLNSSLRHALETQRVELALLRSSSETV